MNCGSTHPTLVIVLDHGSENLSAVVLEQTKKWHENSQLKLGMDHQKSYWGGGGGRAKYKKKSYKEKYREKNSCTTSSREKTFMYAEEIFLNIPLMVCLLSLCELE